VPWAGASDIYLAFIICATLRRSVATMQSGLVESRLALVLMSSVGVHSHRKLPLSLSSASEFGMRII